MKTSNEYKKSLKKMRPNIYKFGELIKDVTTHPATKRTVEGHAHRKTNLKISIDYNKC